MSIQKCKKCGNKFDYKEVLDSVGWGNKPLHCNLCGTKHMLKTSYIPIIIALLSLPVFAISQIDTFELKVAVRIVIILFYIAYISLILGLYPFIVKYDL